MPIVTVRRVVNDVPKKVSMQTLARVNKVIAALNYRPVRAGIAFKSGQDHFVVGPESGRSAFSVDLLPLPWRKRLRPTV